MRLEATITEGQSDQLDDVVQELKTTKSQIVEEALALFLKAFMETKRGRRVAFIEPESQKAVSEVVSPSLTQLEWMAYKEKVVLSEKGMKKVAAMLVDPVEPPPALRRMLAKRKR